MEQEIRKWHAVYTKPRWEKKVNSIFQEKGIISYCPLNKVRKKWSDRTKLVEEPLFKSYVFVHVSQEEHTRVRMINGVLNYVYWNGKPAIIKDFEIDIIKKFMNEYEEVESRPVQLTARQRVRIDAGLLMHQEGVVQKVMHNKVEVIIESLGYVLVATVNRKNIQPV
ncbi:MAG TPA: UpxY family transcription antiterminator [Chitinophagaceae bacterium]|nr:UpxY family transcription antiterminator [Chitinophagaceae bacterium]